MLIDVAEDYSPYPSGRSPKDGKYNAETFRENILLPALRQVAGQPKSDEKVIIDIDGVRTFGSSFLEEVLGGIIRSKEFSKSELKEYISVRYSKKYLKLYADFIEEYLD